jgi:hypothetical protein
VCPWTSLPSDPSDCVFVGVSNDRISASSFGNTSCTGTPSPNFLFNLSIFAHRRVASEGMSKLGPLGGPNAANEIVLGLCRCEPDILSPVITSNGGEAGMVSNVGLTDAIADGGPCATVPEVSLSKGGGLRVGLRTRHESAELTASA